MLCAVQRDGNLERCPSDLYRVARAAPGSKDLPWDTSIITSVNVDRPEAVGFDRELVCDRVAAGSTSRAAGTSGTARTLNASSGSVAGKPSNGNSNVAADRRLARRMRLPSGIVGHAVARKTARQRKPRPVANRTLDIAGKVAVLLH
jgi:hypothetical protein